MDRFSLYKNLLAQSKYFKLVCGAGNEDEGEVEEDAVFCFENAFPFEGASVEADDEVANPVSPAT